MKKAAKDKEAKEESVEEGRKPYPGEYDYTDEKYMDLMVHQPDDDDDKKKKKEKARAC